VPEPLSPEKKKYNADFCICQVSKPNIIQTVQDDESSSTEVSHKDHADNLMTHQCSRNSHGLNWIHHGPSGAKHREWGNDHE
jgi:hypothetical protein